jgi:arginase
LSLSLDVLNPDEFNYVNTPIPNGVTCIELKDVLQSLKKSEKLIAMDIVEFNPNKGENITIISDLIRTALV